MSSWLSYIWKLGEAAGILIEAFLDYVRSYFVANACNLRHRAETAALAHSQDRLPQGWVKRRSLLGKTYYFDLLTWQWSWTAPIARGLYEDAQTGIENNAKLRMAVLLPALDWQEEPECLVIDVDVRAAAKGLKVAKLVSNAARKLTGSVSITEYCFNQIVYAYGWCDCLSYCCGDPRITEDVILNGHKKPVTINLVAALRQFRASADGTPVMLWIDAICINQDDAREKAAIIALLDAIFEVAPVVHMWLGSDEALEPALELFVKSTDVEHVDMEIGQTSVSATSSDTKLTQGTTDLLEKLYQLPYWTRKWIVQEICLARKVVLHARRQTTAKLDQGTFATYMNRLFDHLKAHARVRIDSLGPSSFAGGLMLIQLQNTSMTRMQMQRVPFYISLLRQTKQTVPADSVYAILSLLKNMCNLYPDYERPIRSLFIQVSIQLIHACQSLDLLAQACESDSSLPSWVPDFSRPPREFIGMRWDASEYSAVAFHPTFNPQIVDNSRLQTLVMFFEDITAVAPVLDEGMNSRHYASGPLRIALQLLTWASFCAEHVANGKQHSFWKTIAREVSPVLPGLLAETWADEMMAATSDGTLADIIVDKTIQLSALPFDPHSRLFATTSGHFGFARADAGLMAGDKVVIVANANMPFCAEGGKLDDRNIPILKLKSPCYIDALLEQEAVEIEMKRHSGAERDDIFVQVEIE